MRVYFGRRSRKSGRLLQGALRGVVGRPINFGYGTHPNGINSYRAIQNASNKRRALRIMGEAGVPVPEVYSDPIVPCVARTDRHRGGSGFFLCRDFDDIDYAERQGATHFMEFVEGGREFRVHIAFGKSIKIAEKLGGNPIIRNFRNGCYFGYPQDFNHKKTLRRVARDAIESLGLDFGAVDIIYKDRKFFVLECNSAPSLTSNSDILQRYVRAFVDNERSV